ncbi:MAG TPA: hypothetical protein VK495_04825, partial [Steroidobacteraceae bacterium]|nr:hypothetical protein [Steroidobacteraceae bacterium]
PVFAQQRTSGIRAATSEKARIRHRAPFRARGNRYNLFESCQRDMPKSWFVAPALMPSAGQ